MKIIIFLLSLFFIIFSPVFSSSLLAASHQIKISSDELSIDEDNSKATFLGNVIITQPDLTLWAEKVIVHYGEDGPSDIKDFEAIGNVKIEQPEQTAIANRAIYDPKTKILRLIGDVSVTNDSGTIRGPELIVDIKSGASRFPSGQNGGRVEAIFTPQND